MATLTGTYDVTEPQAPVAASGSVTGTYDVTEPATPPAFTGSVTGTYDVTEPAAPVASSGSISGSYDVTEPATVAGLFRYIGGRVVRPALYRFFGGTVINLAGSAAAAPTSTSATTTAQPAVPLGAGDGFQTAVLAPSGPASVVVTADQPFTVRAEQSPDQTTWTPGAENPSTAKTGGGYTATLAVASPAAYIRFVVTCGSVSMTSLTVTTTA